MAKFTNFAINKRVKLVSLCILQFLLALNILLYYLASSNQPQKRPFTFLHLNYSSNHTYYYFGFGHDYIFKAIESNFHLRHKSIINGHHHHDNNTTKVVFLKVPRDVGYGNQVYIMLSAFLVALLTDSALLIDWKHIDKYVESPLESTFKRIDDSSSLDFAQKSPRICEIRVETANSWSPFKKLILDEEIPRNCTRYAVRGINAYFFDLAANPKYYEKLAEAKFVRWETVNRTRSALRNAEISLRERLERVFAIGFEFAGHVLNNYWFANENINNDVDVFYENEFRDCFVIGLQMRFVYLVDEDVEVFLNCAKQIEKDYADLIGNREVTVPFFLY